MSTNEWQTFTQNFPGDGTTPLNQNTLNLYTVPVGSRIRRTLFHCQLSCQIESTSAADLPVDLVPRVALAAGLWMGNTAEPAANSPSVIDDANAADWLFWDALQERVDTDAVADTGVYRIVWETPSEGLDIKSQRIAQPDISSDLWLGWQFNSDFGFLNQSTDTWNAFVSGYFTIRFLINTP
jgi:hypothetical protein